jgi:hypothetical protein
MEVNPDLPPIEDDDMGVMGLTEVDPSPVEDTPMEFREKSYFPDQERPEKETEEMRGIRRMNTLGLRLGDHGAAWWRMSTYSPQIWRCNTDITL